MLVDTHCHLNMMIKKEFDRLLTPNELKQAKTIINQADEVGVKTIINVGTSVEESQNCILLAKMYNSVWATVGLHPNDCTSAWKKDFAIIKDWVLKKKEHKIVLIVPFWQNSVNCPGLIR